MRPTDGRAESYFLLYRLWLGAVNAEFFDFHAKTTIAHQPAVRLERLLFGLPSLADQQRIGARLSDEIAEAERARKMLEEQLAAINPLPAAFLRRAFSGVL